MGLRVGNLNLVFDYIFYFWLFDFNFFCFFVGFVLGGIIELVVGWRFRREILVVVYGGIEGREIILIVFLLLFCIFF